MASALTEQPKALRAKRIFLWLHRWFGLIAGLYFVLLGLSGSYLVYKEEIDNSRKPHLRKATGPTRSFDLQEVVTAAKLSLGTENEPATIEIPEDAEANVLITFILTEEDGQRPVFKTVFVDPANAEVRGLEVFHETLSGQIFFFHHDLFLGSAGRLIMGISGILMVLLLLTGLYLWWPRGSLRRGFRLGRTKTILQWNLELHKILGLYSLALMIAVTATGVYLSKPDWFGGNGRRPEFPGRKELGNQVAIDLGEVQKELVREGFPLRDVRLKFDAKSSRLHGIAKTQGAESHFVFDLSSMELVSRGAPKPTHERIREIHHDIHAGDFWGELGRALVFLSGILPAFFYVTGAVIWRKKQRANI